VVIALGGQQHGNDGGNITPGDRVTAAPRRVLIWASQPSEGDMTTSAGVAAAADTESRQSALATDRVEYEVALVIPPGDPGYDQTPQLVSQPC
jgi:hypothetical protein